ncbi:LysR family transcriptional regulator [Roseobacteraceae bacterium NS-SX3]
MPNLSSFDLNLLRVFDALIREGSTVRAGRRIGLSQPAVSAALARLRAALGDPLFIRQGQHLVPTDFTRSAAPELRGILEKIEAVISGPPLFDSRTATDRFKISGSDFFAEMLMPALADRLSHLAPGIRLQMVDLVPDNYVDTLDSEEVDLALIPQLDCPAWIDWQPLFNSSFAVVASRGNPSLADAGVEPGEAVPLDLFCTMGHVLFSPEGNLRAMGDAALDRVGRSRRVVMTLPVFYGVCSAVAESDLIALVPQQFARRIRTKLPLEVYRPPIPMPLPLIGMIWHKRWTGAPAHRWLRGQIADLLKPLNAGEPPLPGERGEGFP